MKRVRSLRSREQWGAGGLNGEGVMHVLGSGLSKVVSVHAFHGSAEKQLFRAARR
jgi:hypothetical protein